MSTLTRVRRRRPLIALACAGALALGAAACGDSGSGSDAEPASAVPATAPFYAEIAVNDGGDAQSGAEDALRKILGTDDVGAEIERIIKSSDDPPSDEEWEDVKQVKRIGLFFTSLEGNQPQGAALLAMDDIGDVDLETDGKEQRSYKDVDYWVDGDGDVTAKVEDFVVSGSEGGLKVVIDTVKGDDVETMDDNDAYEDGLEELGGGDALATAYVNAEGLLNAVGRSGGVPAEVLGQLRQQLAQGAGTTSVMTLSANGDRIKVDVLGQGVTQPAGEAGGDATAALEGLPGGSWFGIGLAGVGESLRTALQQALQLSAVGGEDVSGQLQAMEQALGIDLENDLLSWMGDAAVFVQGATVANVGGALVVQSSDPAKSQEAVAKLRRLVGEVVSGARPRDLSGVAGADAGFEVQSPSLPFPVIVASGGDKFVVGLGAPAVEAALSPQSTLADNDAYKAAAGQLEGVQPGLFVDISAISAFVKGLGLDSDPSGAEALKYVDRFGAVIAGSGRDGNNARAQLVITLK
ncbi:MAG TPA: DUF3352 domain-containing protein [Capillimicrobium sp.]|nr:DUF3352 domain-containing protein [Capillimicrobium sp.]